MNHYQHRLLNGAVELALLGHKPEQFVSIRSQPYLKPVLLNDISLLKPKYKTYQLAESRFLLTKDYPFRNTSEIVGTISASWNNKYLHHKIDDIAAWPTFPFLVEILNDPTIVLCATLCLGAYSKPSDPIWIKNFQQHFRNEFKNKDIVTDILYNITGLKYDGLRPAPYANQIICHKSLFISFRKFIQAHIDDIITECTRQLDKDYSAVHDINRPLAYILEEVSMLWWSSQKNLVFVSCAEMNPQWYQKYVKN